ncbi:DUF3782 domain-containing protein [Sulfolobus tengchongensis]|uniref:DUF3782 domain-containing protein n=1 Tax=Sulfolobus tengchongensis TaxID=207809 RepID=A0AAX4L1I2_9CREN
MTLREELLKLLKEDKEFKREIEDLLGLNVIKSISELTQTVTQLAQHVDQLTRRVDQLTKNQEILQQRMDQLAQRVDQLAQHVDQLTQRLDQLTQRLDQLAQHVDQLTQRVDQLTKNQEMLQQRLDQLTQRVDQLTQRLDQLAQRVDQLTQHVDQLTQRVDQLTKNQEILQQRMDQLAQRVDQLTKNQEVLQQALSELAQSVNQFTKKVDSEVERINKILGSMGERWGILYEDLITDFLREVLKKEGLDYKYVNKFSFKDEKGLYGFKGRRYEIDILVQDDKIYMIEVKSNAEVKDVEWFDTRCSVVSEVLGLSKPPIKLFLAITTDKDAVDRANELGIKMVTEMVFERPKKNQTNE